MSSRSVARALHVRIAGAHGAGRAPRRVRRRLAVHRPDGRRARGPRPRPGGSVVRKIRSNFFISLDGVVESPDQWHFPYFNEEMGDAVGSAFQGNDAMLMGRVLYEEWSAYWPDNADQP